MDARFAKQLRVIRHYAKAEHLALEIAFQNWCEHGLAEQWARQN